MKFACPKCTTRYSISDDKVPPAKTLRFPCKKCGNVVRLRRKERAVTAPAPAQLDQGTTRVAPLAELDVLRLQAADAPGDLGVETRVASMGEIDKALEQADHSEADPFAGDFGTSTKIASMADIQRALKDGDELEPSPPPADGEWYVLVAGKQEGPLALARVIAMLRNRAIDKRTYVWRDGMAAWLRLGAVAELRDHAEGTGDAAWRVMAPIDDRRIPGHDEATVAMGAAQLDEHLHEIRQQNRILDPSTADEFEAGPTDVHRFRDDRPTDAGVPVDLADPELIAALSGDPTGERLSRPTSPTAPQVLMSPAGNDTDSVERNLGIESLRQPEQDPIVLTRHPHPDPLETPVNDLRAGFPDALEEPVSDPLHGLGPALNDMSDDLGLPLDSGRSDYLNAPPGESTRVFMATAGIYKRRRYHQVAAIVGILVSVCIVGVLSLDILGVVQIPMMGAVYERTGLVDPNRDRGIHRAETELARQDLDPQRRVELETWLTKLRGGASPQTPPSKLRGGGGGTKAGVGTTAEPREGVKDTKTMKDGERSLAESVFGDARKTDRRIVLADPDRLQAPNLPDGLTQEAIVQVFGDNSSSMTLCFNESTRKGERLSGRMEIEVSIAADGSVSEVKIANPEYARTVMGSCTVRRVKNWRFPRFNGEPVTVVIPYVLQSVF